MLCAYRLFGQTGSRYPRRFGNHKAITGVITRNPLLCPPELTFGIHPEPVQSTQYLSLHIYLGSIFVLTSRVSLGLQNGLFLPILRGHIHHLLSFTVLEHPAYSPNLAPSDYHLFGTLKDALRGRRFTSVKEIFF
jgi:hypothetical protein